MDFGRRQTPAEIMASMIGQSRVTRRRPASGYLAPVVKNQKKVGRNEPCPCGSGKKYKKCCLAKVDGRHRIYRRDPAKLPKPKQVTPQLSHASVGYASSTAAFQRATNEMLLTVARRSDINVDDTATAVASALLRAGADERLVWAYLETGHYVTPQNKASHPPDVVAKWEQALQDYDNASPEERALVWVPADAEKNHDSGNDCMPDSSVTPGCSSSDA